MEYGTTQQDAKWFGSPAYPQFNGRYVWPVRAEQKATAPARIWKTGQTVSYAPGDDGDLRRGVNWPNPRFIDHGDGTVTDNLTGLMWTKDAGIATGFSWFWALNHVEEMNKGIYYPNFGYMDWRLPNLKELCSLADFSRFNPALPLNHPFTNVWLYCPSYCADYWSSTSVVPYFNWPGNAWSVSHGDRKIRMGQ